MNYKPLIIVLGEPYSIFPEIFFKLFQSFIRKKIKTPIIIIGSLDLLKKQMKFFNYKFKINLIEEKEIKKIKDNKKINLIDVNYNFKRIFEKKSKYSNKYINKSFSLALKIIKKNQTVGMVNGPVSKSKFLKRKFRGITEYLSYNTNSKNVAMVIFNEKLSVSPLTTHIPIKNVTKEINKKLIHNKILLINKFYKSVLKINPRIAVLGLNPHCETINKFNEDSKILKPAIESLKKRNIKISGPYPADTFFMEKNYSKYNIVVGMYHDQVLTPIKTIFGFNAINITVGLPFLRVSPDHGPNESMVSLGKSNPISLKKSLLFFENVNGY